MHLVQDVLTFKAPGGTGVGLGNFDGLHVGHMSLIHTLIDECRFMGLNSMVFTFLKHPESILRKGLYQPLITSVEHKTEILSHTQLDYLCYREFDEEFSRMPAERFIEEILVGQLQARLVVVGFNYRFGYMGKGNSELLRKMGERLGFRVIVLPPVCVDSETVSSTLIRSYIQKGNMKRVFELLGRHFSIPGRVSDGRRVGRELGFPTANLYPDKEMVIPAKGVYITLTRVDDVWHDSVTNIGHAPTIREPGIMSIETHLLGYSGNLYGRKIEVCFLQRIRGEKHFDGRDALVRQIAADIEKTREWFALGQPPLKP